MITKTLTGIALFDEQYEGIYRGRAMLACGRCGAGKTIFGLQFIRQGLRQGERCLMYSARPPAELVIYAEAMGIPIGEAVTRGYLILLEYREDAPARSRAEDRALPPDGFLQLQQIIDTNAIQRVVLDTTLPWVAIRSQTNLAEHVFSFVRSFDRLDMTTLLTIPKPVSPMACNLRNAIEKIVPVSVMMNFDPESGKRFFKVRKYLGKQELFPETEYAIIPRTGIAKIDPVQPPRMAQPAAAAPEARVKPSFRSLIPNAVSSGSTPDASGATNPPAPGKIRFSSVIPATVRQQASI